MRNFFSKDIHKMTSGHKLKATKYLGEVYELWLLASAAKDALERAANSGFLPTAYELDRHNTDIERLIEWTLTARPWFVDRTDIEAAVLTFDTLRLSHKDPRWAW